jgi:aspartate/methionine/tyrosine aminotransferase
MLEMAGRMGVLGTETAFEVLARANALAAEGRSIINLGIGQPDFPTPDHIVEAGRKALADGHHGYTAANGIPPLREAVAADLFRRHRVEVSPEQVLVVPGGKVTMFFAIMMFGEPGKEILYPNPGFPIYESAIRFSGATPVPVALHEDKGFSFNAAEVLDKVTPQTRLLILNSPANPTGGVVPRAELDRLVEGLERHPQVAVMSDEIYGEILYDGAEHVSLLSYPSLRERLILLDGWSKTYAMTGWRLGYGVWPKAVFAAAERLAINCHSCVNAATQYAGIAALEGPREPVHRMVEAFAERRTAIVAALNGLPGVRCQRPGGAFYTFPNISGTGYDARRFQSELLEKAGVATIAGTSFGAFGEGFVRFSYANSLANIMEAMDRIRTFLGNAPGGRAADAS